MVWGLPVGGKQNSRALGSYSHRTLGGEGGRVSGAIVPLQWIEYRVYGHLSITYPKPYSICLRRHMHSFS